MSKILTATILAERLAARYPNASNAGQVDSIFASGPTGEGIQAAAVKGFNAGPVTLVYVKAVEHFYQGGEPIAIGDFVQVTEKEARQLIGLGRAVEATDDDVLAAQKAAKK